MLTLLLKFCNFFYGPQAHVRPVPRNVPGDVLRAPLAPRATMPAAHDLAQLHFASTNQLALVAWRGL